MNKRVLAIFATVLVLTACGGSSGSGSTAPVDNGPGNGNGLSPEPVLPIAGASGDIAMCFHNPEQVDSWEAWAVAAGAPLGDVWENPGAVTAELSFQDGKLQILPRWLANNDNLVVSTLVDGPLRLAGKAVRARLSVDPQYLADDEFRVGWWFQDAAGRTVLAATGPLYAEHSEKVDLVGAGFSYWGPDQSEFDQEDVRRAGLLIRTFGAEPLPDAPLWIDCYEVRGAMDNRYEIVASGWSSTDAGGQSVGTMQYASGGVQFEPTGPNQRLENTVYGSTLQAGGADLSSAKLYAVLRADEALRETGTDLMMFVEPYYSSSFSADDAVYCQLDQTQWAVGETLVVCDIARNIVLAADDFIRLGVEVPNANAGTLAVKRIWLEWP